MEGRMWVSLKPASPFYDFIILNSNMDIVAIRLTDKQQK